MKNIFLVFFVSMLPVFELRAGIPLGLFKYDMPSYAVILAAVAGNCIIIMPLLYLFEKLLHKMIVLPFIGRLVRIW